MSDEGIKKIRLYEMLKGMFYEGSCDFVPGLISNWKILRRVASDVIFFIQCLRL